MRFASLLTFCIATTLSSAASAQSLATRVAQTRDGTVRFSFASRPDVCGNGENNIQTGDGNRHVGDGDLDRNCPCEYGPVRVSLTLAQGTVTRIRTAVGSKWRGTASNPVDLGTVSTREATSYLLGLAERSTSGAGGDAIFAVTLADSVTPWPDLIRIARDVHIRQDTRKNAVFWLGQAAGDAATKDLADLAEDETGDREVRESAVFALSQLENEEGVPALIRIARSNKDPEIRRKALFWLGQSDDPRALDLFEELLSKN